LAKAAASDAHEDAACGVDRRGDELPEWVTNKQHRVEKIRAAKAALEAEAQANARGKKRAADPPSDRPRRGRPAKNPPGTPHDRAQRNFTDPDSRIMKTQDGFIQGYNAQAAVDAEHQVIVAQGLTNQASDAHQLEPMLAHIKANTGRQARELSADAGYCFEHNLTALARHHVRGYIATGRQKHGAASAVGRRKTVPRTRVHAMTIRLKRAGYRSRYRLRKQVVEPVFGQIKQARGFRQFLLRGLSQVAGEWSLVCSAHNVLKLAGARG
jgi:Transposase DDE domain